MSTERQRESARANAQNSTGPRTDAGKARSSMNALKSGIEAQTLVLPNLEKQEAFDACLASWHEHHPSFNSEMRTLVDQLACGEWFLRRLARAHTAILIRGAEHAFNLSEGSPLGHMYLNMSTTVGRCQRQITQINRDFHTNLAALNKMEAEIATGMPVAPREARVPTPQPAESAAPTPESASFREPPSPAASPTPPAPPQPADSAAQTEKSGSFRNPPSAVTPQSPTTSKRIEYRGPAYKPQSRIYGPPARRRHGD
jgi:hypothetical protein